PSSFVSLRPRDFRAFVHFGTVSPVKFGRLGTVPVPPQRVLEDFPVAFPQLFVRGKRNDHRRTLALPKRVELAVKQLVGKVAWRDDSHERDAGDRSARASESQDVAVDQGLAVCGLAGAFGRLPVLGVVEDDEIGPRALVRQSAVARGQPERSNSRSAAGALLV